MNRSETETLNAPEKAMSANAPSGTSGPLSPSARKPMHAVGMVVAGVVFGIVLTQTEAASFWRIQEMFRFQSFHMYGLLGMTVGLTALWFAAIRRFRIRDIDGSPIVIVPKDGRWKRTLFGGLLFGLGWGLAGACPGPIFVLAGQGYGPALVLLASSLVGAWLYGAWRDKLPH